jgi:hypothetical protein
MSHEEALERITNIFLVVLQSPKEDSMNIAIALCGATTLIVEELTHDTPRGKERESEGERKSKRERERERKSKRERTK